MADVWIPERRVDEWYSAGYLQSDQSVHSHPCMPATRSLHFVSDPGNGQVIGQLPEMGLADTKTAIEHAHTAFATWGKTSEYERHAILTKLFKYVPARTYVYRDHADEEGSLPAGC